METEKSEAHTGDVDPKAPVDGTSEALPEIFPVDYRSVNKRAPATTDDDLSESRWKQVSHPIHVWWSRIEDDEVADIDFVTPTVVQLSIDGAAAAGQDDFAPAGFVQPDRAWRPPYPFTGTDCLWARS